MKKNVMEGMKPPKAMSGGDLELFDDPKRETAAKAINAGIAKAAKGIISWCAKQEKKKGGFEPDENEDDREKLAKEMGKQYGKHVYSVMKKHTKVGATDTEPRYKTGQALIDMVKGWYFDPDDYVPELGDYMEMKKQVRFGLEESVADKKRYSIAWSERRQGGGLVRISAYEGVGKKPTNARDLVAQSKSMIGRINGATDYAYMKIQDELKIQPEMFHMTEDDIIVKATNRGKVALWTYVEVAFYQRENLNDKQREDIVRIFMAGFKKSGYKGLSRPIEKEGVVVT